MIFLASIFGGHPAVSPAAASSEPAAVVVAVQSAKPLLEAPDLSANGAQNSPAASPVEKARSQPSGIVLGASSDSLPAKELTKLQAQISGLQIQINQLLNTQHSNAFPISAPPVITFPGNTIPTTNEFMSGATVGGSLVITAANIADHVSSGGSSQWTNLGSDIYFTSGNVGIATTSPAEKLTVSGNVLTTGHAAVGDASLIDGTTLPSDHGYDFTSLLTMAENITQTAAVDTYGRYQHLRVLATEDGGYHFSDSIVSEINSANTHTFTDFDGFSSIINLGGSGDVESSRALYGITQNFGTAAVTNLIGTYTGVNNYSTGHVTNVAGVWIPSVTNHGVIDNLYGLYIADQSGAATNPYAFWYDSPGVYRIKGDGVMAYYNPTFTKYTPGATNFERVVQQWSGNVAQYGTENQGTGVARALAFITASTTRMTIGATGNVGIGTTTPWATLSASGTVAFANLTGSTGAGSLCLDANKQVVYNSGSDNCLSSLRSTKHDINPLQGDALSQVAALKPVSFVYNNDTSSAVRYGFIAEDAAAVDPHFGTYDEQGKLSGVDDRGLIAVVVEALQQLIKTVAGFADNFVSAHITVTTGDFDQVNTKKLCVEKSDGTPVCITGDQLTSVLAGSSVPSVQVSNSTPATIDGTATSPSVSGADATTTSDVTPPIQLRIVGEATSTAQ